VSERQHHKISDRQQSRKLKGNPWPKTKYLIERLNRLLLFSRYVKHIPFEKLKNFLCDRICLCSLQMGWRGRGKKSMPSQLSRVSWNVTPPPTILKKYSMYSCTRTYLCIFYGASFTCPLSPGSVSITTNGQNQAACGSQKSLKTVNNMYTDMMKEPCVLVYVFTSAF
jgi:hypothetical protein